MKFNHMLPILMPVLSLLAFSCSEKQENVFQLVRPGHMKEDVKKILGEPYEILTITKTNGPIWGPEEEFWDKIPNGTVLESWKYKDTTGNLNLYFTGDGKRLAYKAFAPQGVVYESGN